MNPWALFGILAIVIFLRLGAAGVLDYDEAAYAEVSRTMLESGDWVTPQKNGEDFFEKPAFIYWTQVVGFKIVGLNAWGARLFNALAALALVFSLYRFARKPLGEDTALLSALILGSSLEPMVLARVTLTDTWLSLWFVLCLGYFHRAQEAFHTDGGGREPSGRCTLC